MKVYWSTTHDENLWPEKSPGMCDSMYFPYAGLFLKKFPWLAVRMFWLCITIKSILLEYQEFNHFDYF